MKKILLSVFLLGLISLAFASADAGYGMMGGMMSGGYGSGMMWYGWLNGLLVTIIFILLIAWLWKQLQKR